MSEIDWREMFKGVVRRMRDAGESHEMGARWLATEADKAVHGLLSAKDAEIAKLREENERLREALNGAAGKLEGLLFDGPDHPIVAKARAALAKEPTP